MQLRGQLYFLYLRWWDSVFSGFDFLGAFYFVLVDL